MAVGHGPVEVDHHLVEASQEGGIVGAGGQRRVADQTQHFDRVMLGAPPEREVEPAEDVARVGVPTPP